MSPEFDLDAALKAINVVKAGYKTPGKEYIDLRKRSIMVGRKNFRYGRYLK